MQEGRHEPISFTEPLPRLGDNDTLYTIKSKHNFTRQVFCSAQTAVFWIPFALHSAVRNLISEPDYPVKGLAVHCH
jgi:hypothetical protein